MARTNASFTPISNPELMKAHNIRVLHSRGLGTRRIALEMRIPESDVVAVLGGGEIAAKGPQFHKPTQATLARAHQAKKLIAQYKARREYASGRDISKAIGMSPNWLGCNVAKGRTNPNYDWAVELDKLLEELAPYGDAKRFKGNNTPLNLRGKKKR